MAKKIISLPSCQSTNSEAINYIKAQPFADNVIIHTDSQTNGRGQRENMWESEENKNLTFSIILRPSFLSPVDQFQLTIACSLGVTSFLTKLTGKRFSIKWPNDILYHNEKICGILIENIIKGKELSHTVIGIGLNINQERFKTDKATSLFQITDQEHSIPLLLDELTNSIIEYYTLLKEKSSELNKMYLYQLFNYEEWSTYLIDNTITEGKIIGVNNHGLLRLELINGSIKEFGLKEIKFIY